MSNKPIYYLCGGTFLGLLIKSKSDNKSETDIMKGLLRVIDAGYQPPPKNAEDSFKSNVSDYKYCKNNYTKYLMFNNQQVRDNFDDFVRNRYHDVLERMVLFTKAFINLNRSKKWLGDALIELLDCDIKIKDNQTFFMGNNYTNTKKELCNSQSFRP